MTVLVPSLLVVICWGGRAEGSSNSSSSAQSLRLLEEVVSYGFWVVGYVVGDYFASLDIFVLLRKKLLCGKRVEIEKFYFVSAINS